MPAPPDDQTFIMSVIGTLSAAFTGVAWFLWNCITRLGDRNAKEHDKMWEIMTDRNDQANKKAIEDERRFATKADLHDLRTHIDMRLDQIAALVVNRNGHA